MDVAAYQYVMPQSWNDKGMDWDNPDPSNLDYLMALKLALEERAAIAGFQIGKDAVNEMGEAFFQIRPGTPFSHNALLVISKTIADMSRSFIDVYYNYDSAFKSMTYLSPNRLIDLGATDLMCVPHKSSHVDAARDLFRSAKLALSLMRYTTADSERTYMEMNSSIYGFWSSGKTFFEAVANAEANFKYYKIYQNSNFNFIQVFKGVEYGAPDYFQCYIGSLAVRFGPFSVARALRTSFAEKLALVVSYDDFEEDTNAFGGLASGFYMIDPETVDRTIGDVNYIAQNPSVPQLRHRTYRGKNVRPVPLADFFVPGGFKFIN